MSIVERISLSRYIFQAHLKRIFVVAGANQSGGLDSQKIQIKEGES
jgi:hypothetical protein